MKPRRSCLSLPATNARMAAKAAASAADQVILDLEDAVAPADKAAARDGAVAALRGLDFGPSARSVRVNDVESPWWEDDLAAIAEAGDALEVVVVPKVADPEHVRFVESRLPAHVALDVLIESAAGAVNVREISRSSSRIAALVFGAGDYAASLGIPQMVVGALDRRTHGHQWQWVMSEIAACAHAVGAQPIDSAYADFADEAGYRAAALQAKLLGFTGKWCIHPNQIPWANDVFSATPEEVESARQVLDAYRDAGVGAVALGGKMIDEATRKQAERTLARSQAISE